jgi:hypothetical protein
MKRLAFLLMSLMLLTGCATATSPTPPLAPGYINQADQVMGQTLAAAHAFYQNIQQDSAAGKVTLSPTEKTALNDLGTALNAAQTLYLNYHNGTATQAAAQTAVNQVTTQQAAVQAMIPGVSQ